MVAAPVQHRARFALYVLVACAAVLCMSSGGVTFALMGSLASPNQKCVWRLSLMCALQTPAALVQYARLSADGRSTYWKRFGGIIACSLVSAANYFTFAASVEYGSLAHTLILASSNTILFVMWAYAIVACGWLLKEHTTTLSTAGLAGSDALATSHHMGSEVALQTLDVARVEEDAVVVVPPTAASTSIVTVTAFPSSIGIRRTLAFFYGDGPIRFPSLLETFGAVLGFAGVVWLMAAREAEQGSARQPSLSGDTYGVLAAITSCLYLATAARIRSWCSLWLLAAPMTGLAALELLVMELIVNPRAGPALFTWSAESTLMGWMAGPSSIAIAVICAAVIPGVLGHTAAALALKEVSPLVLSILQLVFPFAGSVYGYLLGVQGVPGTTTYSAGILVIVGAACAIAGSAGMTPRRLVTAVCSLRSAREDAEARVAHK